MGVPKERKEDSERVRDLYYIQWNPALGYALEAWNVDLDMINMGLRSLAFKI